MKPQLVVALDVADSAVPALLAALPPRVLWYKVGLELFTAAGPAALQPLAREGKRVFLDLKLHDIPNTVARAVTSAARHGAHMLTIHAAGGPDMIRAARDAAAAFGANAPKIVAVTVLTSLDEAHLRQIGFSRPLHEQALALAEMAVAAGADGVVCSVHEAAAFRRALGPHAILVTPGIRPAGADVADQKRIATPQSAVQAGSDFLVVGRPILAAADPAAAANAILREMESASREPA